MPISTFFVWLLPVWAAGWFAFPLALRLTGHALPDGGLALGRIGFLVAWALGAFWLGHVGVPVSVSAWLYLPLAVVGALSWRRQRAKLRLQLRARRRAVWSVEAVFLSVFLVFFALRGYWSDTAGNNGEKPMDAALIGTLVRAQSLPPENPYSAGAKLSSYYIFGHLQTALLTSAAQTSVRWSYNLMCATLPALCFAAMFSLGAGLTKRLGGGAWVSATILGLGTLQPLYQWFRPDGLIAQKSRDPNVHLIKNLDFFAVSRPLPNAINEFPWFTFNQADLHAHYFDFPIQIALMALAWTIYRASNERLRRALLVVAGVFLGAQILTNTWDFPAYALAVGLAFFLSPRDEERHKSAAKTRRVLPFVGAVALAVALAVPYLLGINTAARGPSALPQPASPLREWLLMWAPISVAWFGFCSWRTFRFDLRWRRALGAVALLSLVAALAQPQWGYPVGLEVQPVPTPAAMSEWFNLWNPARLVVPLVVWSAFLALVGMFYNRGVARFLPLLALAGLVSLAWSETTWAGFLGDPNFPGFSDAKRQDTVFKFGLQSWFLWGTAATTGAYLTLKRWPIVLRWAFIPFLLVMALSSFVDTLGRARGFDPAQRQNWDGWAHLKRPEQEAATWLLNHVPPGANLLEAEDPKGGDYSEKNYSRYAHATGVATVIGPRAHAFQWSPNPVRTGRSRAESAQEFLDRKISAQWEEVFKRKDEAREAFTTKDSDRRRAILKQYRVRFVVWGELERLQYGEESHGLLERDLSSVAKFGFDAGEDFAHRVEIFRVN